MEKKADIEGLKKTLRHTDSEIRNKAALALDRVGWEPRDDTERVYYMISKKDWGEMGYYLIVKKGW